MIRRLGEARWALGQGLVVTAGTTSLRVYLQSWLMVCGTRLRQMTLVTYARDARRLADVLNSGQILAIFYRDNRYVTYNYTDDHLLQSVTAPDPSTDHGRVTTASYLYDAEGRPVKVTDAAGHVSTTSYFADGLKQQECGPPNGSQIHCTTYAYDANGNVISVTDPRGLVSTTSYYADNKVQDVRDAAGNDTHYVYDPAGRALSVCSPSCTARDATNPSGTPTTYQYFKDNLLKSSLQPFKGDGSVLYQTNYGYDQAGLKVSQDNATVNSSGVVLSDAGAQTFRPAQRRAVAASRLRMNTTPTAIGRLIDPPAQPTGTTTTPTTRCSRLSPTA